MQISNIFCYKNIATLGGNMMGCTIVPNPKVRLIGVDQQMGWISKSKERTSGDLARGYSRKNKVESMAVWH
jgi:hypothetical protein